MDGPPNTEIDVDEIMRKIRDQVKRRNKTPGQEILQEREPLPSKSSAINPLPGQLDIHVLPHYINYHGFLAQAREKEGLKGKIKYFLFKFIRFFAWWQEQINRTLYHELMSQKSKIDEGDRWLQELLRQQVISLQKALQERDKLIQDLGGRLALISQSKDELLQELGNQKNRIDETGKRIESLLHQQNLLGQGMSELTEADQQLSNRIESTRKELSGFPEVKSAVDQMTEEVRNHKFEILEQHRRLGLFFEEARKRLPGQIDSEQIKNILTEEDHLLNGMYVAFEDRFRGTREDIKGRLKIYLDYVKKAKIGERDSPVLDLGCGRGEWLELLKENGVIGKGVDFNRVMVRQCQELGLDVTESDMVEYLKGQPSDSLGGITGFHILEHLPLKTILSLLDEALRVLKHGGMVIFETPNLENLIVATCNFHFDPTHRTPLPPPLLNFLIQSRGFEKTEIIRLHPYEFPREQQNPSAAVEAIISLFNKEQDVSVIGYKG